jgi:hypothetical protein
VLSVNDEHELHVATRLFDFFAEDAPWHRRLWEVGTVLSLRELAEASEAVVQGTLAPAAVEWFRAKTAASVGPDPGVGPEDRERRQLQELLRGKEDLRPTGAAFVRLSRLTESTKSGYLERWGAVLSSPTKATGPERAARYIAAHLLDLGFSGQFLSRWWRFKVVHEPGPQSLGNLVRSAQALCEQQPRPFEVLLPFAQGAAGALRTATSWRTSHEVAQWLRANGSGTANLRPSGGWLVTVNARDRFAAAHAALELVERVLVRASIGSKKRAPKLEGRAWVGGELAAVDVSRHRSVAIHALDRQQRIGLDGGVSSVDDAIELVAHLDFAAAGPAVATGWAAIEALLSAPGDAERVLAGDRLAVLVACSFVRAELTSLAHHHSGTDALAAAISAATTNRERAQLMADALTSGTPVCFSLPSDFPAIARMRKVLLAPAKAIKDVQEHATKAFRRLYRLRNLVLHQGKTDAVALNAALRTAAPLVGAGFDRVTHAWYANRVRPLELATVAQLRMELVRPGETEGLVRLLD